jgi:Tfp pilus assembly PilM family ATPase
MTSLTSLRESSAPGAAVEIASGRVSAASLEWRGKEPFITAHASEALAEGALVPSLTGVNTHDRSAVVGALERVLDEVGRPWRVGLVVPDVVAKVSFVRFEQVPQRAQDLDQLVRWQVRKTAPFPIDDAQIGYVPGLRAADGQEFIVSLAKRAVIEEYESLCADAGAHAGIVDLATFNVINTVLAGSSSPTADWLLVNVAPEYVSIAIMRGPRLIFFRNRAAETDGTLADLVHQTAMYYEDRLNGAGFSRVIVAGAAAAGAAGVAASQVRRSLEDRLSMPVDQVDPKSAAALTDRISTGPALRDTLAPLVGLLLRDRDQVTT